MRFQVPQFIEVEDKIIGPFTLKQFIYLAGGAGLSFVIYVLVGSLLYAIVPISIVIGLSLGLALFRLYDRFPLVQVMESAFKYYFGSKLYVWRKEEKPRPKTTADAVKEAKNYATVMVPKISDSKLKDLAWSLDIKESVYSDRNQK